jgi:TPR repeat protein
MEKKNYFVKWRLLIAAIMGHAESQYRLGLLYEYGSYGFQQDEDKAIKWYFKAADHGHSNAKRAVEILQHERRL